MGVKSEGEIKLINSEQYDFMFEQYSFMFEPPQVPPGNAFGGPIIIGPAKFTFFEPPRTPQEPPRDPQGPPEFPRDPPGTPRDLPRAPPGMLLGVLS